MILLFDMNKIATLIMAIKNYYSYFFLPLILIYLLFNIFDGNNGFLSHTRLNAEIASLETKVENIKEAIVYMRLKSLLSKNITKILI